MLFADLLDLLVSVPRGNITPTMIQTTSDAFLHACVDARWRDDMHPKFHWSLHVSHELRRFGVLLTCWVHERKHRMAKRYASDVLRAQGYEKTVIAEVTCQHLSAMHPADCFSTDVGLVNPRRGTTAMRTFFQRQFGTLGDEGLSTASRIRVSRYEICHRGDLVLLKNMEIENSCAL